MRRFPFLVVTSFVFLLSTISVVAAQPSLEKLEKKLKEAPLLKDDKPGYLGLSADRALEAPGVEIVSIKKGSPAQAGGLKVGDRLIAIAGKVIANLDDMSAAMIGFKAGDKIELDVDRAGRREKFSVTLGTRPKVFPPIEPLTLEIIPAGRPMLGVTVLPVTDEARLRYRLTVRRGAVIDSLQPGSPADRYGLPIGGVIVAFDGRRIDSPDDLIESVANSRFGQAVELTYYDRDRLYRKTVRLAPVEKRLLRPPVLEPGALRRLEGSLERLPLKPDSRREIETLRKQILSLQKQLEESQRRLAELEKPRPEEKKKE